MCVMCLVVWLIGVGFSGARLEYFGSVSLFLAFLFTDVTDSCYGKPTLTHPLYATCAAPTHLRQRSQFTAKDSGTFSNESQIFPSGVDENQTASQRDLLQMNVRRSSETFLLRCLFSFVKT